MKDVSCPREALGFYSRGDRELGKLLWQYLCLRISFVTVRTMGGRGEEREEEACEAWEGLNRGA